MKCKVFRSGEKGFEEQKDKIFGEEVKVMSLTKEEQLRLVFKKMITNFFNSEFEGGDYYSIQDDNIKALANNLILEVKIRTKL